MSSKDDQEKGICILSFDSGGPGTYSQLLIMKDYMNRMAFDLNVEVEDLHPADYFDLIGGVGFGGLATVMLGILRMSVDQAIEGLLQIASAVFPTGSEERTTPEMNMRNLKEAVEELIQAQGITLDTKMNDKHRPEHRCKVVLFSASAVHLTHSRLFRAYKSRQSSLNPTIVEAVCATMAIPALFPPVKIGPHLREQSFVGGAIGANNPTRELLKEAQSIFGKDKRVAQVISLGSGRPRVLSLESTSPQNSLDQLLKSIVVDCEGVATDLSTRLFDISAYLRLNVDRGMDNIEIGDWDELAVIESHTLAYIESTTVARSIENSLKNIRERIGSITLGQINQSSTIKVMSKMAPAVSPYFVLRQALWDVMLEHLISNPSSKQKIFVLTGMGGCGKTQLVSYFLQEYHILYIHIVFVDASSTSSIRSDLQNWARSLGEGHGQDTWEDAISIFATGSHEGKWVLVYDNADDPEVDLVPLLPRCYNGTIIITSRNKDMGHLASTFHLEVGPMNTEEALSVLIRVSRLSSPLSSREYDAAMQITNEIGCLAVALTQAGSYCAQMSSVTADGTQASAFEQYLRLFMSHRPALMKKAVPLSLDRYRRGAYTTLDLSYAALVPLTRKFLHLVSRFHHSDISLDIIEFAARYNFAVLEGEGTRPEGDDSVGQGLRSILFPHAPGRWDELHVQDLIQNLRSFSLVSTTVVSDMLFLQIHPLVRGWAQDMLPRDKSSHYDQMAIRLIVSSITNGERSTYRYLVQHIISILDRIDMAEIKASDCIIFGEVLGDVGYYNRAEAIYKNSVAILEKTHGRIDDSTMLALSLLAEMYYRQGRWKDAEELQVEILEARQRMFGPNDILTLTAMSRLAATYRQQERWVASENLQTIALFRTQTILGPEDPQTLSFAAQLASLYRKQGHWEKAANLEVDILERTMRTMGPDHFDTLSSQFNLGSTLYYQGNYEEAEMLLSKALNAGKMLLGEDHPFTITAAGNLGNVYGAQGRWNEKEQIEIKVLEYSRRKRGASHPRTLIAAAQLVHTYTRLCKWDEAEKLGVEVMNQTIAVHGREHPDSIQAISTLSDIYMSQEQWDKAEPLQSDVVELSLKASGTVHPDAIQQCATVYRNLGNLEEAIQMENLLSSLSIKKPSA